MSEQKSIFIINDQRVAFNPEKLVLKELKQREHYATAQIVYLGDDNQEYPIIIQTGEGRNSWDLVTNKFKMIKAYEVWTMTHSVDPEFKQQFNKIEKAIQKLVEKQKSKLSIKASIASMFQSRISTNDYGHSLKINYGVQEIESNLETGKVYQIADREVRFYNSKREEVGFSDCGQGCIVKTMSEIRGVKIHSMKTKLCVDLELVQCMIMKSSNKRKAGCLFVE